MSKIGFRKKWLLHNQGGSVAFGWSDWVRSYWAG